MSKLINDINNLKDEILKEVTKELKTLNGKIDHYEIAWRQLQEVSSKVIVTILENNLPSDCVISIPSSKSVYPDIKIQTPFGDYAIDIKGNESSKNPWFDMGRLDTLKKERLDKYVEEWELVIKYDSRTQEFIQAYFLLFREAVGIRNDCQGLKYRPYDGKIRPKSWQDFDDETIYWQTKEEYLIGLENAITHRWFLNIKNHLLPVLSEKQKEKFRNLFE